MAERIPGINFTGPVVPNLDSDTYPSHYAKYGKGGWREVATIADRDAISAPRREEGMAVFVTSEAKLYILNEDLETWSEFKSGSTDSIRKTDNFDTFKPLFDGEIVQYIGEDESGYESYVQGYFYKATLMEESGEDPYYVYTQIDVQPATDLVWGNITGTLSEQTDLQEALDEKIRKVSTLPTIAQTNGEIVQYVGETTGDYIQGYFYKGTFVEGERVDIDTSSSVAMGLVITNIDNYKAYLSWLETKYSTTVESLTFECTGGPMVGVKINDGADYVQVCDPSGVNDPSDTPAYYGGVFSWIGLSITNPSTGDEITVSIENTDPSDPSSYEWTPVAVENTIDRVRRVESFPALPERTNEIVQYIGNTTINYHHGYFYQSKYESIVVDTSHAGTLNVEVSDQTKFDFYVSWLEERYGGTLEWLKFENTDTYMIATYSNLVDGDYTAVYNPTGEPSTGNLYSGAFPSWVGLTFSNADSNTGNYLTVGVGGNPEDPNSYTWNQVFVQENYPVIDNVTSTSTTSALSANQGRLLQDQIDDLKNIGRFLSTWDCGEGLPETEPETLPYTYHSGDYFLINRVIVPTPSSATISQTSGTGITADVDVSTLETFMGLTEDEDLKFWYTDYLCVKTKTSDPADDSIVNVVNTDKFDALYQTQSQIPSSEIDYPDFYSIRIEMYTEYVTIGTSMTNCYKVRLYRLYYNEDHTRTHHEQIDDGINSPISEGKEALNALLNEEYGFELRGNLIVNPVIGGHQNNSFEITKSGTDEWTFGLADVDLSNYGIEMTGSGSADDVLTVEYTAATHNYRPVGSQYTGEASKTWLIDEDNIVKVNDVYVFDGNSWSLQYNSTKTVSFDAIAGNPYTNTELADALNNKVTTTDTGNKIYGTDDQGNQTTYDKNSFGQVDDVQIHGTSKVVNKVANLLVAEQCDQTTMPVPSQDLLGRIVQYIGPNGLVSGYVHGYFYECQSVTTESYIELEVIKQPGTQLDTVTCDKDLLEANQGATRDSSWDFISHGGWNEWYLDDEHIDLNDWGIAYQGEPSEDDEIYLEYYKAKTSYRWVAIPVQPDAEPITAQQIEDLWSE